MRNVEKLKENTNSEIVVIHDSEVHSFCIKVLIFEYFYVENCMNMLF